ncbi:uncharacterized protein LOC143377848 isoform X2 [Andrena cerasifolii]|uniref:uncharacterized protein LOC143377848 isoform X2 n=1 Tax=Andrena cerasifolii TaxID=2819439 RepID=UPI0040378B78
MLSANDCRISEKLLSTAVEKADVSTDFDELDVSLFESYPVLVQPNLVIQICLKNTLLLEKLHVHINDCNNYPCMFSKIIEGERMKSLVSIIQNDTMDNARQEFKQCIHDCTVWWKLFKHFNKDANPRRELGRCLFQTFSSKCREPVLYKMQLLLTDTAET